MGAVRNVQRPVAPKRTISPYSYGCQDAHPPRSSRESTGKARVRAQAVWA